MTPQFQSCDNQSSSEASNSDYAIDRDAANAPEIDNGILAPEYRGENDPPEAIQDVLLINRAQANRYSRCGQNQEYRPSTITPLLKPLLLDPLQI